MLQRKLLFLFFPLVCELMTQIKNILYVNDFLTLFCLDLLVKCTWFWSHSSIGRFVNLAFLSLILRRQSGCCPWHHSGLSQEHPSDWTPPHPGLVPPRDPLPRTALPSFFSPLIRRPTVVVSRALGWQGDPSPWLLLGTAPRFRQRRHRPSAPV